MTSLVLGLPSKGRLQEQAQQYFSRAGMDLLSGRGARAYRGRLHGIEGIEIAYLSASDIVQELAQGHLHLGITGEDLIRDSLPQSDSQVCLLKGLGFGQANVVVAVPQAWIDVRTMADLDEVASSFMLRHGRKLRVATKYLHLTRQFFAQHGVMDYRIVESPGATEGAPAAGTADLIVDITSTGSTLAANALKVLDDGVILRSQANLVASLTAGWSETELELARGLFDRISAMSRAQAFREVRCRSVACTPALLDLMIERFSVVAPFGGPTSSGMLTLHCPHGQLQALADFLRNQGAQTVSVVTLDYVFDQDRPLDRLLSQALSL